MISTLPTLTWTEWLVALVATPCILAITTALYNLTLHPLAHVPGPFWARASGLPSWYHAVRGDRHLWLLRHFETAPGTQRMRVAPNEVVFRDPDAYPSIYGARANVRRSRFYEGLQRRHDEPTTLTTVDVAEHHRRRKRLSLAFTEKSVRAASDFVVRHVDRWNEVLLDEAGREADGWSSACDMSQRLDQLIFDIMGDLSFGRSFDIKEPGANPLKVIPHAIAEYMRFYYPVCRSPLINLVVWLRPRGLDALIDLVTPHAVRAYNRFVHDSVTQGIALYKEQQTQPEEDRRRDLLYFLCDARDQETGRPVYEENDLRGEASLLLIAGSDTTAISLSSLFFYLTGDPARLDRLVAEVRATFPTPDDVVYGPTLLGCTYLRACIDEGMRLTPSGPSEMPREILPGGQVILGERYPAGVVVGCSPWLDFRDRAVYGDDVRVFRPERWIPGSTPDVTRETVAALRNCFHPFTTGLGACLGKNLAVAEMMITVARTLHRLEVRRAPGSKVGGGRVDRGRGAPNEEMHVRDAYITLRHGPEVQFRSRDGSRDRGLRAQPR